MQPTVHILCSKRRRGLPTKKKRDTVNWSAERIARAAEK